jgi:hypothetical protein
MLDVTVDKWRLIQDARGRAYIQRHGVSCGGEVTNFELAMAYEIQRLRTAGLALAPWMSAALDDESSCKEFREAASDFLEAFTP